MSFIQDRDITDIGLNPTLSEERRTLWVRIMEPPEGSRWLRNEDNSQLWVSAEGDILTWIETEPRVQTRLVSEWKDAWWNDVKQKP